jgi:SAM-dependent methyltransferase
MARRLGLTSLEDERMSAVSTCVRGRLLDIGAGANRLVREYGNGIGVDVFDWGGGTLIVEDTSRLPFADEEFDTISFVACLNHIPNREAVLREARRLLAPGGQVLITMISPVVGYVGHRLFWWYSEDKTRGMAAGETYGLSAEKIQQLAVNAGFVIARHSRFVYGLNHLYELKKAISQPSEVLSSKPGTHQ